MKKIFPWVCLVAMIALIILLVAMGMEILLLDKTRPSYPGWLSG